MGSFRGRWSGAGLSELALLAPDEIEVAKVDEESRALTHDEDGVAAVNGVEQEHAAAPDGEEPEGDGDHALLPALRGDPLHEEAAEEEGLSEKAYRQPELFSGHDRRLVGSQQLGSGHTTFFASSRTALTLPETAWSGNKFSSSHPLSGARFLQRVANGLAKCFDGLGTDQRLAIDEESRRAGELGRACRTGTGSRRTPRWSRGRRRDRGRGQGRR